MRLYETPVRAFQSALFLPFSEPHVPFSIHLRAKVIIFISKPREYELWFENPLIIMPYVLCFM